jgi:DNA-binding response OmpR family regulator
MATSTSTVLIVDDDPAGQMALESLLVGQGYALAIASSGEDAYTKAQALKPDLILLDIMMPGMDGIEVCRLIRANPVLAKVPIIMVTALDDQESRLHGIKAGADDFITKSYHRAELRARVKTVIRLNRYRHLYEQSAQLEWVVESATDGYIRLNAEDRIEFLNSKARV